MILRALKLFLHSLHFSIEGLCFTLTRQLAQGSADVVGSWWIPRTYIYEVRRRLSVFNHGYRYLLFGGLIAFEIANLHLLENRAVEEDSEGLMGSHDEARFPLRSIGIFLECCRYVELENACSTLLPFAFPAV